MLFKQRVEIVEEYETWLRLINKELQEEGSEVRVKDCTLTFLSWIDGTKHLIREDNNGR